MSKLSISEAARQAGISRQYFYTKFIRTAEISVSTDEAGNKYIDDAELLRVCNGRLPLVKTPSTPIDSSHTKGSRKVTDTKTRSVDGLQVEVQLLREQLRKTEERELRLLDQVDRLTKQIEHKTVPAQAVETSTPAPAAPDQERQSWIVRLLLHKVW